MTNSIPQVKIVNCTTGEEIVRDATEVELSQIQVEIKKAQEAKVEAEAKATARAAILDRLGLTAEEAALLLS